MSVRRFEWLVTLASFTTQVQDIVEFGMIFLRTRNAGYPVRIVRNALPQNGNLGFKRIESIFDRRHGPLRNVPSETTCYKDSIPYGFRWGTQRTA